MRAEYAFAHGPFAGTPDIYVGSPAHQLLRHVRTQKESREPDQRKLDSHLLASASPRRIDRPVAITVRVRSAALSDPDLASLRARGLRVEYVGAHRVDGWLDLPDLDRLAELPEIVSIRTALPGRLRRGGRTTEGDALSGADRVRALGYDGMGVIVGVVSDGIDSFVDAQATGDLPAVSVPDDARCRHGRGDEGTALLEIVHDLAPGAQLLFSSGIDSGLGFAKSVECLAAAGARVIVDDIGFFDEPFFEDGPVAAAVRTAVRAGVTYHTAAGNEADEHLEQPYQPAQGMDVHDFLGGAEDTTDDMLIAPFDTVTCVLQWDDPYGAAVDDYDLYLFDETLELLDAGTTTQDGTQDPIEFVVAGNPTPLPKRVKVTIAKYAGAARLLKMFCLGGLGQEYVTPTGSIIGHAALPEAVTVGAVDVADPGLDDVEPFSSHGPARVFFPTPVNRPKPDLVAFDGVSISNAGGFPRCPPACRFFGTSAAAPHAAAVAALMLSKNPFLTPATLQTALQGAAIDIGAEGEDEATGRGRLDAFAAVARIALPACRTAGDCDDQDACTSDTCAEGTCTRTVVTCESPGHCEESHCDFALGCIAGPVEGYGGTLCRLGTIAARIEGATGIELSAHARSRLQAIVERAHRAAMSASAATQTGRAKRENMAQRRTLRLLARLDHVTHRGLRRAQIIRSLGEFIALQLGLARNALRAVRA